MNYSFLSNNRTVPVSKNTEGLIIWMELNTDEFMGNGFQQRIIEEVGGG